MKKKLLLIFVFVLTLCVVTNVFAIECDNGQDYVACGYGKNAVTGIPTFVPRLIAFAVALMRILIPVVLIITGTIEMFKSIISGNPDNIAKGKKRIIGKYVGALLAFFIISFTTNIVKLIARGEKDVMRNCFNCFLNNKCNNTKLACQGTMQEKEEYLTQSCEDYTSESECPQSRCVWSAYSQTCKKSDSDSEKPCADYTIHECPTGRCMKDYSNSTCTNVISCSKYLTQETCPTDRCKWAYGSTGGSVERSCMDK